MLVFIRTTQVLLINFETQKLWHQPNRDAGLEEINVIAKFPIFQIVLF